MIDETGRTTGDGPTTGDDGPGRLDDSGELENLRQFFYQCPVGLVEIDDDGLVDKVNPAAVAMLAPAIGSESLTKLFPVLDRLSPQLVKVISQDRDHLGPLAAGQRMLIPAEVHGTSSLEIRAVRVAAGRVMVVLLDVSAERRLAAEGTRLLEAEKVAHAEAAAARDRALALSRQETATRLRLQVLQTVTAGLAQAVTSGQIADVLARQGMALIADHGAVSLLDPAATHLLTRTTSDFPAAIADGYARIPVAEADETPVGKAAITGQSIMLTSLAEIADRCPLVAASHPLTGTSSILAVPVLAGDRSIGALSFGFRAEGPIDADTVLVAETLAELTGQALERARLYEVQHAAAHKLQQALLPAVPAELPGAGIGVCYRPAARGHEVGGDWYDAFELPSGRIGFAVGDVAGHDLDAAVAMGRLQQTLRYVAMGGAGPAAVLQVVSEACPSITGAEFATLGYAEYDPAEGVLIYACAAHPPPLLVIDGRATYLSEGRSAPISYGDTPRAEARLAVRPGGMLVWYSDGLIERRGEDLDRGFGRLAAVAAGLTGTDAQHWSDSLLAAMTSGQTIGDDIVVACLHLRGRHGGMPPSGS